MLTFRTKYTASPLHRQDSVTLVLSQYSVDCDRELCLTHQCKTVEQMRAEVERLKNELDAVVAQAADKLGG